MTEIPDDALAELSELTDSNWVIPSEHPALAAWLDSLAPPAPPKVGDTITDLSALTEDGAAVRDNQGDAWVALDRRWRRMRDGAVIPSSFHSPFTVLSLGWNADRLDAATATPAPPTVIENREQLATVPVAKVLRNMHGQHFPAGLWWVEANNPHSNFRNALFPLTVVEA